MLVSVRTLSDPAILHMDMRERRPERGQCLRNRPPQPSQILLAGSSMTPTPRESHPSSTRQAADGDGQKL